MGAANDLFRVRVPSNFETWQIAITRRRSTDVIRAAGEVALDPLLANGTANAAGL